MIITQLSGGLGNQMYQYATGRRLAHVRGVPLKLDLTGYGPLGDTQAPGLEEFRRHVRIKKLNISAKDATLQEIAALRDPYTENSRTVSRVVRQLRRFIPRLGLPHTHFAEKRYRFDPEVLSLESPCFLQGFWQSEKYFEDIADIIRTELRPSDPQVLEYARNHVDSIRRPGETVVSLHVRRGELAVAQEKLKSTKGTFGPPTSLNFIERALAEFPSGHRFLVFSDSAPDIEWCRKNIRAEKLHFSEGHDDIQDMTLMSACDHHIIASTFSWWGAWLNNSPDKRVVAPSQWGHPGGPMVTDDLIPKTWKMV
ncbi:alpha-1,2-fucosyltransferase [Roseimicrobium sp. ORNL1]|uniref:alpha-1,2-fucosyltransferase n=1 Tax=Roseimicrobium sp. ORNL1 TaxID=2711231 RepID=UPI0013E1E531|nr:alpha-1,2-fucosyltransferase [Roseimicrobium sp. ORNL1]QIF04481.1 alpha-1,2-fucosyltransferase [Roseimicrobium sp. ORNL1]